MDLKIKTNKMNRRRQKSIRCEKKRKAWNNKENKEMTEDGKKCLKETDNGLYYNQEACIEKFKYSNGFYHVNEYYYR